MEKRNIWPLSPEVQALKDERARFERAENIFIGNDHEDVTEKLKNFSLLGLAVGTWAAAFQVIHFERPKTHSEAYRAIFRVISPPVAMAAAYATSVKISAAVRNRDDSWNHIVAGFIAGSVWGARTRSQYKGLVVGGVMATLGCFLKMENMYEWNWFSHFKFGGINPRTYASRKEGYYNYNRTFHPYYSEQPLESEESSKIP